MIGPDPVVTAVSVGQGQAVHALAGRWTAEQLRAVTGLDTFCGAVIRARKRHRRGRAPVLAVTSAGYGITCLRCRRSLGLS